MGGANTHFPVLERLADVPRPADVGRAARGWEAWREAAAAHEDPETVRAAAALADDPRTRALVEAITGHSPFLTQNLIALPKVPVRLLSQGPDEAFGRAIAPLAAGHALERAQLARLLRRARRRVSIVVALADVGGLWPVERVTEALSTFADAAVQAASRHLLLGMAQAGDLVLPDPARPEIGSGLVVLALGKHGSRELNYSSDIDIMVLYDPQVARWRGKDHIQAGFVRLTRELVKLLQDRTADGYVLRTDLRLRPDPSATPVAVSCDAAESYYESLGQNWERAALIKARAVAGDLEAGAAFLKRLTPFVWRRHLDFAAIQDIHSIKRQINAHKGGARIAVAGHNIKVGRGGIREIEFYAQTQQLIWGGRDPSVRQAATCPALRALVAAGRTRAEAVDDLIPAYRFLRTVEHRLQMIDDQQTQTLPSEPAKLAHLASFLGFSDTDSFAAELMRHLALVERHYAALFEEAPALSPAGNLVFTGTDDDPDTLATLAGMGYTDGPAVAAIVRGWHHGRYRAMRSTRARELLTELMPTLLGALARTANPDAALLRFDEFLRNLPAGLQLFSLFYSNPRILDLVATIMGMAPRLAETLSHNTLLLDGVLNRAFEVPLPHADALAASLDAALDGARDAQDTLDIARRWTHDHQFQVGIQMLQRIVTPEEGGAALSDVAEAVLRALTPRVEAQFAQVHGWVQGAGFAVLGLGKLGGREMTATSDLDLVMIYDNPQNEEASDGPKPLPVSQYFTRLGQRLITALTALTGEGRLYEIDMRLRPSGNKGPVASEVIGFFRYQREDAWPWEHMALTRARVLAAPAPLRARIGKGIREVLCRQRDPAHLAREVDSMRLRIAAEHGTADPWDVKHVRGGLVDIDFIAQYLQLRDAAATPAILATATVDALDNAARLGALDAAGAGALVGAARLMQRVQGLLRLTMTEGRPVDEAPRALKDLLVAATGAVDFAALGAHLESSQQGVREAYERLVAAPARTAEGER